VPEEDWEHPEAVENNHRNFIIKEGNVIRVDNI
jgi:hypothetical protein